MNILILNIFGTISLQVYVVQTLMLPYPTEPAMHHSAPLAGASSLCALTGTFFCNSPETSENTFHEADECVRVGRMWLLSNVNFLFKISKRQEEDGQNSVSLPVLSDKSC